MYTASFWVILSEKQKKCTTGQGLSSRDQELRKIEIEDLPNWKEKEIETVISSQKLKKKEFPENEIRALSVVDKSLPNFFSNTRSVLVRG